MTSLTPYALTSIVSAVTAVLCGAVVIARERFSTTGWIHLLLCLAVALWQCTLAGAMSAPDAYAAQPWLLGTTAAVILVPTFQFHFTHWLARGRGPNVDAITLAWIGTAVCEGLLLTTDIVTVSSSTAGERHAAYGPVGVALVAFMAVLIAGCLKLHIDTLRNNPPGGLAWCRARMLLFAWAATALGMVDQFAALGLRLPAIGGVFFAASLVINLLTTWRYRLIEITPALAAQQFMDTMSDGVVVLDHDGMVRLLNPAACEILGYRAEQLSHALPPRPVAELLFGRDCQRRFPADGFKHQERQYQLASVGHRAVSVSLSIVRDGSGHPLAAVATLHDMTATRAAQEQIRNLAYYDPLTGLPNRLLLKERFSQVLAWAERARGQAAVLFLDLDRFKQVNDTLGHEAGDLLLKAVAERVTTCVRESDIVVPRAGVEDRSTLARLGGDEFVLLLSPIDRGEDAATVAERILQMLSQPVTLKGGEEVVTGVSIGIALYPGDGTDADTLLKKADIAMYHAKESGRSTVRFFDEGLNAATDIRVSLETGIRRAMVSHEFLLKYQPVIASRTGAVMALEVQLWWNHPQRGLLAENTFGEALQETGIAPSLGAWVIRTACVQARSWVAAGRAPIRVMVSVHPMLLERGNLLESVRDALSQTRLEPRHLWLCLRQSRGRGSHAHVPAVIQSLTDLGVQVILDDFGTGQVSVADLISQPVGMARLNGGFIEQVARDADSATAARALLGLIHGLGMQSVASGVNASDAAEVLRTMECDFLLGNALAPAVDAEEIPERIGQIERAIAF